MGKKVLKAFNHQRNVNKNYTAIQCHVKKTKLTNTGEEIRKKKLYNTLGGNVNQCSHYFPWRFLTNLKIQLSYYKGRTHQYVPAEIQVSTQWRHAQIHVYCSTIHKSHVISLPAYQLIDG
jgi:hypothetical protein